MTTVPKTLLIDYGVGNLRSVERALRVCGSEVVRSGRPEDVLTAERIFFPGVGAFPNAMAELHKRGLVEALRTAAKNNIPLLGICLGMQLLFEEGEEFGTHPGLGLLKGRVVPLPSYDTSHHALKKPHIGWKTLHLEDVDALPLAGSFYFIHSFQAEPTDKKIVAATCDFGGHKVVAAVKEGSVIGCQFHPEKSGPVGLKFLEMFLKL